VAARLFYALVAIFVAMAVPVSQVRTRVVVTKCCCPDPSHCHCPDHNKPVGNDPTMSACHRTQHELASAEMPAFAVPTAIEVEPSASVEHVAVATLNSPKPAPPATPPYGPS
jgi:hypothetical protein